MNARTFGTDDKQGEFFARYGATSYEQAGQLITEAQRSVETPAERAWVAEQEAPRVGNASARSVEFMVTLWLERSTKATAEQVRAWGRQQDQAVVSNKISWLLTQPKLQQVPASAGRSLERHNVPAGRPRDHARNPRASVGGKRIPPRG